MPPQSVRRAARLSLFILLLGGCTGTPEGVSPVSGFELERYLGTWYEIARLDHRFERGLTNVMATYSLGEEGGLLVVNRGYDPEVGEWKEVQGKAYFLDDETVGCCSCAGRAWKSYFDALESSGVKHLPLEVEAYPRGRFLSVPLAPFTGTPTIHATFHHPLDTQRLPTV